MFGTNSGLLRSEDNGQNWILSNGGFVNMNTNSFIATDFYSIGNYLDLNGSFSDDGGLTWFFPLYPGCGDSPDVVTESSPGRAQQSRE